MGKSERSREGRGRRWHRVLRGVFCCSCIWKRRVPTGVSSGPEEKRARTAFSSADKENEDRRSGCRLREWIRGRQQRLVGPSLWRDNAMDLGALENKLNTTLDNLYERELDHDLAKSLHNGDKLPNGTSDTVGSDVKRSQPLLIQGNKWGHLKEETPRPSSMPAIPNPFPELCSPAKSPNLSGPTTGWAQQQEGGPHVVKVFSEDGTCRSLEVTAGATSRHVCEMLVEKTHSVNDESWSLVEFHPHLAIERCLEDHESVVEVQATWPVGGDSKFIFRKNFTKYEMFKSSPHALFPESMVAGCLDANKGMSHSELIQNFLNSGSCPEIQGFLHLKEIGRKVWKRFYFFLRRSGLYYSTKGTSKDPRHLQYFADVSESTAYLVTQGKKLYSAPTEFGFCLKPHKTRTGNKGLKICCSEDEQSRKCWMMAFRLFKSGLQLFKNYQLCRRSQQSWGSSTPVRSASDNTLVAMDFSGCTGRVIDNPNEALSAALEEAQSWRKKTNHRYSLPTPCQTASLSAAIHRSQAWYHGGISREETQRLILQQGLVDGVFLVRESQRNTKGFVLSLCHLQKVKHYLIMPHEEEGQHYYTMDDGQTKFTDLIQLVEFHQINRGILPCKLKHYCTRVA
ncbi:growth factor receptor-bound protein 7 isoform X1 [Lissotriton helveticus]